MEQRYMQTPLVRRGWIALGLLVLGGGGAAAWHFYQHLPPDMHGQNPLFVRTLIVTMLLAGLCFICGTAQWWLKK